MVHILIVVLLMVGVAAIAMLLIVKLSRNAMEHKGVEYVIVQTANPTGWKWTIHLDQTRTRTGLSPTREGAVFQALRTIDKNIASRPKVVK
jgi:hypothetical protein